MITKSTVYRTEDGTLHDSLHAAENHEIASFLESCFYDEAKSLNGDERKQAVQAVMSRVNELVGIINRQRDDQLSAPRDVQMAAE